MNLYSGGMAHAPVPDLALQQPGSATAPSVEPSHGWKSTYVKEDRASDYQNSGTVYYQPRTHSRTVRRGSGSVQVTLALHAYGLGLAAA